MLSNGWRWVGRALRTRSELLQYSELQQRECETHLSPGQYHLAPGGMHEESGEYQ